MGFMKPIKGECKVVVDTRSNYKVCYEKLCLGLAKHDPIEMAARSGALYDHEKKEFTLLYFNKEYLISYPMGEIRLVDSNQKNAEIDNDEELMWKMLIISYLLRCKKANLTKIWVPFRELRGVGFAYDHFALQGISKLVKFFGTKGDLFLKASAQLGAKKYNSGDIGVEINVFPNVPLVLILWLGDEEFEATGAVLYDYSATEELHVEDLAILGSMAVNALVGAVS